MHCFLYDFMIVAFDSNTVYVELYDFISCLLWSRSCIPISTNQWMSSLVNRVARPPWWIKQIPIHWLKFCVSCRRNEVELYSTATTCFICPGEECLPKEVVINSAGNAGISNLMLNVSYLVINKTALNIHWKVMLEVPCNIVGHIIGGPCMVS